MCKSESGSIEVDSFTSFSLRILRILLMGKAKLADEDSPLTSLKRAESIVTPFHASGLADASLPPPSWNVELWKVLKVELLFLMRLIVKLSDMNLLLLFFSSTLVFLDDDDDVNEDGGSAGTYSTVSFKSLSSWNISEMFNKVSNPSSYVLLQTNSTLDAELLFNLSNLSYTVLLLTFMR